MSTELLQLQRALQAHLMEADASIADAIDSSAAISAATRLEIYYDAYRLRLIDALEANYPVLAQLLGKEEFSRLTQLYVAVEPSRHYSIRWFGHRLPDFLKDYPDYREQPWLHELAHWEWATTMAFDAKDAQPLTMNDLAALAPEAWADLKFGFHPSVQRLIVSTNVAALIKAASAGQTLPAPRILDARGEWLLWRQALTVQYRSVDAVERAAIDAALAGESFSSICEAIAEHIHADEAPLRAASLLKNWLGEECLVELNR